MINWRNFKLDKIAKERRDNYQPNDGEELPYVGLEHIEKDTLHLNGFGVSSDTVSTKRRFYNGDILFGSLRPYFRKVVFPTFEGVCSTDITVLRAKENVDSRFLFYFISNQDFIDYATIISYGTKMPRAPWRILKESEWKIPPFETQKKIGRILSEFDKLFENNTRRIQTLEELAQLIYREWFVHYRFPGHEQVKMVDSGTEFGEIPEGWEVLPLSELVETQYGYTASAQNEPTGPKFLRGMDINKSSYVDWSSVPYCEIPDNVIDKFQLKIGDIVIIRMADPGKVGIIEQEVNAIFASYLVRLIIKSSRISPYFLFYFLNDEKYQGYITGASTGTTRKSASAGVLVGVDILCPSTKIMDDYNAQISSLRDLMNNLIMQNNNLRTTRDLLLPKLISGEVDVSDIEMA